MILLPGVISIMVLIGCTHQLLLPLKLYMNKLGVVVVVVAMATTMDDSSNV
jgi:hypothetical protein